MTRKLTDRTLARRAGYEIHEGSYIGTTDDRLGRWYYHHPDDGAHRPLGAGHGSQRAAWEAAAEHGRQTGRIARPVGRPVRGAEPVQSYHIKLEPAVAERAREIGGGNLSGGLARAVAAY